MTSLTRTATVLSIERLDTHVHLCVRDTATRNVHAILLRRTNAEFHPGELVCHDVDMLESVTHPWRPVCPRLVHYWDFRCQAAVSA